MRIKFDVDGFLVFDTKRNDHWLVFIMVVSLTMLFISGYYARVFDESVVLEKEFRQVCPSKTLQLRYYSTQNQDSEAYETLDWLEVLRNESNDGLIIPVFCPKPYQSLRVGLGGCSDVTGILCGFPPNDRSPDSLKVRMRWLDVVNNMSGCEVVEDG